MKDNDTTLSDNTLRILFHHVETPSMATKAAKDFFREVDQIADFQESGERSRAIHPSTLSRCNRQAAMELVGVPRTNTRIPGAVKRAANIGKALHSDIQKRLIRAAKKSGNFLFEKEVSIRKFKDSDAYRYELEGSCDGCLTYNNECLGLEIKGLGTDYPSAESQKAQLRTTIPEEHLLQASVYQHCLNLKAMIFLYVKRETLVSYPILIRIPDPYWYAMRKRASLILDLYLKDQLPPGTSNAYDCTMCAFRPTCPEPISGVIEKAKVWELAQHLQGRDLTSED